MSELNAVVIQGKVYKKPIVSINKRNAVKISFILDYTKNGDSKKVSHFYFPIKVSGKLAVLYKDSLEEGTELRLVGSLRQKDDAIFIFADHLCLRENSNSFTSVK